MVLVDTKQNARVGGLVQLRPRHSARQVTAGTFDLEVEALRVRLGAVGGTSAVEGDDFVTQHVVARLQVGGDLDEPAVAVVDEGVGGPDAVVIAGAVDLEEAQGGLVDGLAVAVAGGEVVDHGALVGVGPDGIPFERDLVAGFDGGVAAGRSGGAVADDVRGAEGLGGDEAVVFLVGSPADYGGRVGEVGEDGGVVVLVLDAVDDDLGDVAVGGDEGGAG